MSPGSVTVGAVPSSLPSVGRSSVAFRLHVTGMHSTIAFSPFRTYRPLSFQTMNVAIGPGGMPRSAHCISEQLIPDAIAVERGVGARDDARLGERPVEQVNELRRIGDGRRRLQ